MELVFEPAMAPGNETMEHRSRLKLLVFLLIAGGAIIVAFCRIPSADKPVSDLDLKGRKLSALTGDNIVLTDSAANIYDISNFTSAISILIFDDRECGNARKKEKARRKLGLRYMKQPVRIIHISDGPCVFALPTGKNNDRHSKLMDEGSRLSQSLGISSFPAEIILDSAGTIREVYGGAPVIAFSDEQYMNGVSARIDSLLMLQFPQ